MVLESTKILCWNCRGLMKPEKNNHIKTLMRKHRPVMVCLVETRADAARATKFCNKLSNSWDWAAIPAQGMSGGIIILWKKGVGRVTPIASSRFSLHLVLSTDKPKHWVVTVIYNAQSLIMQNRVWKELSLMASLDLPWILVGDFNAILSNEEHRGGGFDHYLAKSKAFNDFINDNELHDLGFHGSPFTWTNNQSGLARRWARLDRFFANTSLLGILDTFVVNHLPRTASDHSPILLTAKFYEYHYRKIFRFENYWLEHENCHQTVSKAWNFRPNSTPMHAFNHLLNRTRKSLTKWKEKGLSPIDKDIAKTEEQITYLESIEATSQYSELDSIALRALYNKHTALMRQNSIKAQRAKLMWLKNGDYNTSFFHQQAKVRVHRNKISAISDSDGNLHTEHQSIGNAFIDFYTKLWTPSSTANFEDLVKGLPGDLPTIDSIDREMLDRPITLAEIYRTLRAMPKGKSPGPDGFNAEFYLFYWDIIKEQVYSAISQFFHTAALPKIGNDLYCLDPKEGVGNQSPRFQANLTL
ncbi:hypothetical protein J5N97_012008 [Dioscorea zingiberensis]|uniref:Endonuclease/exonuclease/phosphatase domain-containing protein n=1 Tax=Dioscorea zingiberensis TaxID=325984 RepID=A0A9D5HHD5_9LILI|nr:hypothetical protein J5N97_012008 [Dioscorea zingiberensis]